MSSPGRKSKTAAFKYRAKAYYYAMLEEAERELGRPATYRDLNALFASHVDGPVSKVWFTYKAGDSLPGRGSPKRADTQLAKAIDSRWPRAALWRDHAFWTLIDRIELTEENVHALILSLSDPTRIMLMGSYATGDYSRWLSDPQQEVSALCSRGTFDDLAGLVALVREAELRQELFRYEPAKAGMISMFSVLHHTSVTRPFADELCSYMLSTFNHMWMLVPGHYHTKPRLP